MSMIKQMKFGNIGSMESFRVATKTAAIYGKIDKAHEKLVATLNEEQKTFLKTLIDNIEEQQCEENADIYQYAFSIGLGLGYESGIIIQE